MPVDGSYIENMTLDYQRHLVVCSYEGNLVGDGEDMSPPPLFYPRGTNYVLSPPLFDPDFDFFFVDTPYLDVACLGRH